MMSPEDVTDEQLAAYLAGDVDDLTARRIDARLAEDAELGRRLDRLGDTLVALRSPDEVEPPEGLRERLRERTDAVASPPAAAPTRRWYGAVGAVAAGIIALALLGGLANLGVLGGGAEDSAEVATDTMDAPEQRASDEAAESDGAAGSDDAAGSDESAGSGESAGDADAPTTQDAPDEEGAEESAPAEDEGLDSDGGTEGFRGSEIPVAQASRAAQRRWDALPDHVAACREQVEDAVPDPSVPLAADDEVLDGRRVVVYELATVIGGSDHLDARAEVVADAESCEILDVEPPTRSRP